MTVRLAPNAVDELLAEPGAAVLVAGGAALLAEAAAELAPVTTGHLEGSYDSTTAVLGLDGLTATAYTDDVAGHLAEWGSANNPPYAPLRRGADRIGLRGRPAIKGSG